MANTNDSFIEEVTDALRRDRLNLWFRRWGWMVVLAAFAIVALAGWIEWRQSQARAVAELRGEAILTALDLPQGSDRLAALSELPKDGQDGVVAAFLLAAEQVQTGNAAAASATLDAVAKDAAVPQVWRDLAAFKAQLALGDAADPAALQALAAPGQPYRLLAKERLASVEIAAGRRDEAIAQLNAIREDAEVTPAQTQRVADLLTALGAPPPAGPAPIAAPAE